VMDLQRKTIYGERNAILDGKSMLEKLPEIVDDLVYDSVEVYCPASSPYDDWDLKGLQAWLNDLTGRSEFKLDEIEVDDDDSDVIYNAINDYIYGLLEEQQNVIGEDSLKELVNFLMLNALDSGWIGYMQEMQYLKNGIGLRAYGQRDPVVEYRDEAFNYFGEFIDQIYEDLVKRVLHLRVAPKSKSPGIRMQGAASAGKPVNISKGGQAPAAKPAQKPKRPDAEIAEDASVDELDYEAPAEP
ncbi:MAG: preprotein translocase subunit SecA, partial [Eggerthellaceae bacterium]|nr:preprotein translocase subunit SecA [Eggerthellaceae bacterium]